MSNLGGVLQQLQQLQLQQNAALAATASLGSTTAYQIIHDIRSQQENLINQHTNNNNNNNSAAGNNNNNNNLTNLHHNLINKQHHSSSLPDLDPAILGAAPSKPQSIWGDMAGSRQSPITTGGLNPTPPPIQQSVSPLSNLAQQNSSSTSSLNSNNNQLGQFNPNNIDSNLLAQQLREFSNNNGSATNANMINLMMSDNNIKDKIQRLFEQTKLEEDRRRKQDEYQQKVKNIRFYFIVNLKRQNIANFFVGF